MFAFYERGGPHLDSDLRERELPAVREWEDYLRSMVAGFVSEAVADRGLDSQAIAKLAFVFDFPAFRAMRSRGLSPTDAAQTATEMAIAWLGTRPSGSPGPQIVAMPGRNSEEQ